MRKVLVVLVVLLIAGAFVAGYWPQREKLIEAQAETVEARRQLAETRAQLDQAEAKARLGRLFGQFLALEDAVLASDYAGAQALSSSFFNAARGEVGKTADAATVAAGSSDRMGSRTASDSWSAILSGWPSVTLSEVKVQRGTIAP